MRVRLSNATVFFFIFLTVTCPVSLFAASAAAHKAVFTFGGLNERSGVLFVAKDAGIFQKHGLDAEAVGVRSGAVGLSALAAGETQFRLGDRRIQWGYGRWAR